MNGIVSDSTGRVRRYIAAIVVIIAAGCLVSGCAVMNLLEPNTLVKTYSLCDGQGGATFGGYDIDYLIRAREIGNMNGTNDFDFTIELKSVETIGGDVDTSDFGIPRLISMQIEVPDSGQRIIRDSAETDFSSLDTPPLVYWGQVIAYFQIRDVELVDDPPQIRLDLEFALYDRQTHQLLEREHVIRDLERSEELAWFRDK